MASLTSPPPDNLLELSSAFYESLKTSDRIHADQVVDRALQVLSPLDCAEALFGPALSRLGQAWDDGEVALAQLYMAGRICENQLNRILPESTQPVTEQPRLAIAVLADHHALGKRIVSSFLRSAGFGVTDYGTGLDPDTLAAKVRADKLDAILVSVLMLPSALLVEKFTELLKDEPVKVFVGGAPFLFDSTLWQKVGAHAMGRTAASAVDLVRTLPKESA